MAKGTYKPTGKPRGRPVGTTDKNRCGLSLEKRLKILSKIAMDKNAKPSDVINACKEITALLNDKVKETEAGNEITVIRFDNNTEKPKENIPVKSEFIPIQSNTTTETTTQLPMIEQVIENSVSVSFEIKEEKSDKLDE